MINQKWDWVYFGLWVAAMVGLGLMNGCASAPVPACQPSVWNAAYPTTQNDQPVPATQTWNSKLPADYK